MHADAAMCIGSMVYVHAAQVPEDSIEAITDLPRLDSIGSADADDVKARRHGLVCSPAVEGQSATCATQTQT